MTSTMTSTRETLGRLNLGAGLFGRTRTSRHAAGTPVHPALAHKHSAHAQTSEHPLPAQAAGVRRISRSNLARGSQAEEAKVSETERGASLVSRGLGQQEQQVRPPSMAGRSDHRGLPAASLAMQHRRRASQNRSVDLVPAKRQTNGTTSSTVDDTAASSVSMVSSRRASKTLHHSSEAQTRGQPGILQDLPNPFYSFVASCHRVLDSLANHVVPESVFDMYLRHITYSRARDDKVTVIRYVSRPFYREWNIGAVEKTHPVWYDKIQQDILQLYNDWHHLEYPGQHRDKHWGDVTVGLMDSSRSPMERFINEKCVLNVVGTGAQKQFILWTSAHIRHIAEKKHGALGALPQQIKVKGSKIQGRITVHVDETLEREQKKSLHLQRLGVISDAPPLPSIHRHFKLEVPAFIEDSLQQSDGRYVTPRLEEGRRSHLAIQERSRERTLQDELEEGHFRGATRDRRPQLASSQKTRYSSYRG